MKTQLEQWNAEHALLMECRTGDHVALSKAINQGFIIVAVYKGRKTRVSGIYGIQATIDTDESATWTTVRISELSEIDFYGKESER